MRMLVSGGKKRNYLYSLWNWESVGLGSLELGIWGNLKLQINSIRDKLLGVTYKPKGDLF